MGKSQIWKSGFRGSLGKFGKLSGRVGGGGVKIPGAEGAKKILGGFE